ncbi:virulence RhuM family protein [Myroides odoratimimus]|uniref:Cell filamentation protein Fic n=1 Tax=Myroides odoratimimus TaxID=76832 RepID=A0AAI8C783_9FLAO|nr:virulence RhuM family protein [Myroides odoratimimus]ALU27948.1 cell filamentation protein Fic [Myroides odoratimimus]MCA4806946.1 virulence RhuM family protein [Myroides odoratimimus]MDM1038614.1 virulence RhuM family protein [Myroides odoratimimus]MDM1052744.1 virulence RhuM family protein [Myroides odoratimimus]MDM1060679.1 virulence RhuM family protein [Myroides odoratimimus]
MKEENNVSNFLFYHNKEGKISVQVIVDSNQDTIWASQKTMSEIFGVDRSVITKHIANVLKDGELEEDSVCANFAHTASDGKNYKTNFYNLDMILSVGYRVNSVQATQFRKWANGVLREYLIKGFALDDERLKQGQQLFGKDYFEELVERIREIRSSERLFYQKITDIYATSIDYDPKSKVTQEFYAILQNKLHWAIHNHTAAELIKKRANSNQKNVGLTSWKNEKQGGKILKSDVVVAKNYLNIEELTELNRLVSVYLDFAENMAKRQKAMKMTDWIDRLDAFLSFNEYDVLKDAGKVSAMVAEQMAEVEYNKYRIVQNYEYMSDFDRFVEEMRLSYRTGNYNEEHQ